MFSFDGNTMKQISSCLAALNLEVALPYCHLITYLV